MPKYLPSTKLDAEFSGAGYCLYPPSISARTSLI